MRGAWIEIGINSAGSIGKASLPVRGAWIEMAIGIPVMAGVWSLPVRGAWIEMSASRAASCASKVAPRAGSVD